MSVEAYEMSAVGTEPGVAKPDPILVVDGVLKSFGGLVAVDVDHLEIQRGVITALIGPNGAGKTTFFNVLTGFERPDGGVWHFDGRRISGRPAHRIARLGMIRTFQLTKALSKMSVSDNMKLAATGQSGERFLKALLPFVWTGEEAQNAERASELLSRFRLDLMAEEYAATLSGGQRKLLEMARALMVGPQMLMLDEPVAGVNPVLTQSILAHVAELRDSGMTILFVEHDMDVVMGVSDWVVCMAAGQIIAEGPPAAIRNNKAVIDAYLGTRHDEPDIAEGGDDRAG